MNDKDMKKIIETIVKPYEDKIKDLQKQIDELKQRIAKNDVAIGALEEKVSKH